MHTNPSEDISTTNNKIFVSPSLLTNDEIKALIRHAPDPKTRLWLRILHDTGMRKASLLNLRVEDLALEQKIPHIKARPNRPPPGPDP